jgi:hypothetical protein
MAKFIRKSSLIGLLLVLQMIKNKEDSFSYEINFL